MITFRYEDYGSGIIGKIWVGTDDPSGKFFQILVPDPEEKIRFVEELKWLDEMLPKTTTILPQRVAEKCIRCKMQQERLSTTARM